MDPDDKGLGHEGRPESDHDPEALTQHHGVSRPGDSPNHDSPDHDSPEHEDRHDHDRSEELLEQLAAHDPTGQQGRPLMVSAFLLGLLLVLAVMVVIGILVL